MLHVDTHSQPFNEVLIFNDKTRCCNNTSADVDFTLLLEKEYYFKNRQS